MTAYRLTALEAVLASVRVFLAELEPGRNDYLGWNHVVEGIETAVWHLDHDSGGGDG